MIVTKVEIVPIHAQKGLIAFASVLLDNSIYLGSIGVHKRLDGSGFRISYPTKKIGTSQPYIHHPLTQELSHEIESAITSKMAELFGT